MDFVKNLAGSHGKGNPQTGATQQGGGGGFTDQLNNMGGGGQAGERNEGKHIAWLPRPPRY